jgi:hypothetical protein
MLAGPAQALDSGHEPQQRISKVNVSLSGPPFPAGSPETPMISHPHQCIFIHIPKTAGNSVNRAFGVPWQNHKDLTRYARELSSSVFNSYYKFAIIRNPWERLLSDYNYQKKKSRPASSKLALFDGKGGKRDFRSWVSVVLADPFRYDQESWGAEASPQIHRWSPQLDWITVDGRIAVDRVVRWERLSLELPAIIRANGGAAERLTCRNRRFHLHYSRYYDAATRALVQQYYAKDIETFEFRFEPRQSRPISTVASRLFRRAAMVCASAVALKL